MNPGGPHRRDQTTLRLLEAAAEELIEVGQADFTMEGLARRAFFSVGAVYNRWNDREQCIAETAQTVAVARLESLLHSADSLPTMVDTVLANPGRTLTLVGECFIATQNMAVVREPGIRLWILLQGGLQRWMDPGMAWYLSTLSVGGALIDLMDIPRPSTTGSTFFVAACRCEVDERASRFPGAVELGTVSIPEVPSPSRTDEVAASLIEAARTVLADRGASGAGTRDIATAAGVTTGALYRRYEGKSSLLADVLVSQLEPDRYLWTWDLIRALANEDPYGEAADVLAHRIVLAAEDRIAQQVLLQIGVAARNDPALRAQVQQRIAVAIDARRQMIEQFQAVSLLSEDLDPYVPAWAFQALPVGMRAALAVADVLDLEIIRAAMRSLLMAAPAK